MPSLRIKVSIFINYFIFAILLNSIGTVILQVQHNFGVAPTSSSLIELCKDISIGIGSFIAATFISRIGYKKSMLVALALVSFACFMMPLIKTFFAIKLLFAICGASFALTKMSVLGTIGLIAKDEKEYIGILSFIEAFFMVGIVAGYFIFSGFMDDANNSSLGWFNVYYVLGGIAVLAFFMLLISPLNEKPTKIEISSAKSGMPAMFRLMLVPAVVSFIMCTFLYVVVEQSIMSWLPTYNNKVLQLASTMSVQVTSILAAATALGRLAGGMLMKKINWFPVLVSCLFLAAILVLIALRIAGSETGAQITSWLALPVTAYLFPLIGFFLAPVYPTINAVMMSNLPREKHAAMSAVIVVFSALGGMFGSMLTGVVFEFFGGKTAFYFSLLPIGVLLTALFIFERARTQAFRFGFPMLGKPAIS